MRQIYGASILILLILALFGFSTAWIAIATGQGNKALDADKIGQAAGTKATKGPDGVVRLAWPRNDVPVTIDGMAWKPAGGLGSWAAFTATKQGAMLMGDTVVFQDE